jgi:hypothetical protein
MNFTFKPTILSGIIIFALCFWCVIHIPLTAMIPALGLAAALSFIAYFIGKFSIRHEIEDQAQYEKITTQAEQIDEISLMPTISLFPDIQVELYELAIQKYAEIGNIERINQIRSSMENILL